MPTTATMADEERKSNDDFLMDDAYLTEEEAAFLLPRIQELIDGLERINTRMESLSKKFVEFSEEMRILRLSSKTPTLDNVQ